MRNLISFLTSALLFIGFSSMMPSQTESKENPTSKCTCTYGFSVQNLGSTSVTAVYIQTQFRYGPPPGTLYLHTANYNNAIYPSDEVVVAQNGGDTYLDNLNSDSYITLNNEWYGSLTYVDAQSQAVLKTEYFSGGTTHNISLTNSQIPSPCMGIKLVINTDY